MLFDDDVQCQTTNAVLCSNLPKYSRGLSETGYVRTPFCRVEVWVCGWDVTLLPLLHLN